MRCSMTRLKPTRMSRTTRWAQKAVDQYIDQITAKVGKGNGGAKIKNTENQSEDITKMIDDLKK